MAVGVGGNVWWGYKGGALTDQVGDAVEYFLFDFVIKNIDNGIDEVKALIQ